MLRLSSWRIWPWTKGGALPRDQLNLVHRTPKMQMQMETLKKLQGQIVAIRALLFLSPALFLLESWLIPPMAVDRKITKVQTQQRLGDRCRSMTYTCSCCLWHCLVCGWWCHNDDSNQWGISQEELVCHQLHQHALWCWLGPRGLSVIPWQLLDDVSPRKINSMVQLTNAQLWVHRKKEMSKGELICFFGRWF
jgi:hypothetical protein